VRHQISLGAAFGVLALLALIIPFTIAIAQDLGTFIYTNDDVLGPNTVSAFRVNAGGALTPVTGSPFSTGGSGVATGAYAASKIAIAGKFLYASNSANSTVAGFAINALSGGLAPIAGSPFSTSLAPNYMTLTATPNGAFLMAAVNEGSASDRIEVLSVNPTTGVLTLVPDSPFFLPAGGHVTAMRVTPDGKYLYVACWYDHPGLYAFAIGSNGTLTPLPNTPFAGLRPVNVEIDCRNRFVFAPANAYETIVNVSTIGAGGVLTPISSSPVTVHPTSRGEGISLDPSGKFLFVSNFADAVTALNVATDGSLSLVSGSPFTVFGGFIPAGMAMNRKGNLLYVANTNKLVSGLAVSSSGALTPVLGSPFLTGNTSAHAESLVVYPLRRCPVD
jgi:6-phosphogluconolactonase (cycloisomerase 2 family)